MDDVAPSLEVGFAITPDYGELVQLQNAMGTAEAKIVAEAANIEKATGGMLNLGGATANISKFSAAATREAASAARELARIEKAGEALSRQLERDSQAFGKTREEMRAMKVEAAAVAAEQAGLTELSARLRAQEADLWGKQYAAMRQARAEAEALAQEKLREAAASAAEAKAISAAAAAHQLFEAKVRQGVIALREQTAAEKQAAAALADLDARARRLIGAVDPLAGAQDRFNREMAEARTLISAGVISLDQYVAKLRLEQGVLDATRDAHARGVRSIGALNQAMTGASYQVQDFLTQVSMGANPINAFAVQGAQLAGQFAAIEGRAGAVARFMIGPWGLAITGGLLVLGALTKGLLDNEEASKKAEEGMRKFQDRQSDIQNFIDVTTGKLIEQNRNLVMNANLTRQAQIDANDKSISEGRQQAFKAAILTTASTSLVGSPIASQITDPRVAAIIKSAGDDVDKLSLGLGNLARTSGDKRFNDLALKVSSLGGAAILAQRENEKLRKEIRALNGDTKALGDGTTALINKQVALATATTPLEKARAQLALVQDRAAAADKAGGAALVKYRQDLTAATKAVNSAEAAQRAATEARREAGRAATAQRREENQAERLSREAEAIEAQIRNIRALAAAYEVSGAAALIAEARVKAESQAIKEQGDIEASVNRQVRLAIAQRVADGARSTAAMRDQADIQAKVNDQVAAGLVPAERAGELIRNQLADLPLLAAIQAAQQRGLATEAERATKALADQRAERERLANVERHGQFLAAQDAGNDRLAELREELRLIGATDEARVEALATLKATQEAQKYDPEDRAAYIAQQVQIAVETEKLVSAQRNYNDELDFTADRWDLIARNVQDAARGLADAFGEAGRALGDIAATFANYRADQERLDAIHLENIRKAGKDQRAIDRENAKYALANSTSQIGMFGDMAAAAKGFFEEGSDGYKALQKAEQTFRAIQFALSIRAMAQDAAETAAALVNGGIRTAKLAVEAVVKAISSLPFPLNLAAGAATAGAIASLGIAIGGAFGGSKSTVAPANTGTGTVLGDSSAKSESIKNAIDQLRDVDTVMLTYSRQMAASLKSIDSQIGGFAAVLVRNADSINASSNVQTGFKMNTTGSVLKGLFTGGGILSSLPIVGGIFNAIGSFIGSLFGTRTDVIGSGLYGGPQSLGSVVGGGYNAQYYSDVQKTSKFLGIVTGRSTSTEYSAADPALANQFTLILKQFYTAISAAAVPLGAATSDIESRLNSFVIDIGKIDLQGLTGDEIEEKLTAIFGQAADNMASAAFPGILQFQKVGEGAFETLVRVASTVEAVSASLDLLGQSSQQMGIAAKLGLSEQFESVSALNSAADAYFQAYYSQAEQTAARTAQMTKVFASLGMVMPDTLEGFRRLVEAQDLTTTAGQAAYATLLQLAPAFADLKTAMEGAKSAADIASERENLQRQILELRGDTAAIRQMELAKLDASNRALQLQIWAIQDAQDAAKAADELRQAWVSVGDSITAEVARIRGLTTGSTDGGFAALQSQFNAANLAARGGDQDAAKSLPGLSQALLASAAQAATSRQELARIQAQTAAMLEATNVFVTKFGQTAVTDTSLLNGSANAQAGAEAASNDNTQNDVRSAIEMLQAEVAAMRAENNAGHAATASNTGKASRILENVSAPSGGDAIATVALG